jgi:hypothetical protein
MLFIQANDFAQSYGLKFNSHEVVQEKRTCLELTPGDSLCFAKDFELQFDLGFLPRQSIYFGYVVRIISLGATPGSYQNIDLIYNQQTSAFKLIVGESFSGISFAVDSPALYKEWTRIAIRCDLTAHTLQFMRNGKQVGTCPIPAAAGSCFKFLWGANDFQKFRTRDIPPMRIKDIRIIEGGATRYDWPLDEVAGDKAADKITQKMASVKNSDWIKPKYQNWELTSSFVINGYAGLAYDAKQDRLFVSGSDSLAVFTFGNSPHTAIGEQHAVSWIPTRHEDFLLGHQTIYDTGADKLYDVFIDRKTVSTFDFNSRSWDIPFVFGPLTEYWHANKFISDLDGSLYIAGGYGQLKYKNAIQQYHFATKQWDSVKVTGDYFSPHYLSALGTDPEGKYAYIVGGYGSHTGDQMLDPRNYYDFFRFDVRKRSFKKLFALKPLAYPFTFANSLVLPSRPDTSWYGLLFANDSYNSSLQLIQGSFTDSAYRMVGSAIPYSFHDIRSFADLYYSPVSNKLIAVTLFYSRMDDREKNTQVRVYTLNFPPEPSAPAEEKAVVAPTFRMKWILLSLLALVVLAAIVRLTRRLRFSRLTRGNQPSLPTAIPIQPTAGNPYAPAGTGALAVSPAPSSPAAAKPAAAQPIAAPTSDHLTDQSLAEDAGEHRPAGYPAFETDLHGHPAPARRSSIWLFGPFEVIDKEGHDITRLFTPLLKELFLIITTYTIRNGKGISSEGLNELLWHDKAEKDAKNNRSVNIAKLKVILEKIGHCVINKESGYWQFQLLEPQASPDPAHEPQASPDPHPARDPQASPDPPTTLDYRRFANLVQGHPVTDTAFIHQLLDIIKRGPFLYQTEYNWLDDIKSDISNTIIDRCLNYIQSHDIAEFPEFIIEIANCIFYFDQLNEDALAFKCKSLILIKRHTLASNTYHKFVKDYKDIYSTDFDKTLQEIIA